MELIRLHSGSDPRFAPLFSLYQSSFPLHEQRRLHDQLAALGHPDYHCMSIEENGAFCGLLMTWETPEFIYVEHFAICPDRRGTGLGSRVLAALCRAPQPVILEIDPPQDDISIRRRGFYERAGFFASDIPHIHPAYRRDCAPHRLVLMSSPGPLTPDLADAFRRYLSGTVMTFSER